uniref:Uncharacterized protein n=1 Tax=Rhizophora mucronata TaxID=61149 RepID=A0A2P2QTJ9_RHIMU
MLLRPFQPNDPAHVTVFSCSGITSCVLTSVD